MIIFICVPTQQNFGKIASTLFTGVHNNQDLIWCVKMGVYVGFWVHRGSWLLWLPVNTSDGGSCLNYGNIFLIYIYTSKYFEVPGIYFNRCIFRSRPVHRPWDQDCSSALSENRLFLRSLFFFQDRSQSCFGHKLLENRVDLDKYQG